MINKNENERGTEMELSPHTERSYARCRAHISAFFDGQKLTATLIEEFKKFRLAEGASPSTINLEIKVLRLDAGEDMPPFKFLKESRRLRYLKDEEIAKILDIASPSLRTAILIGLYTGLRKSTIFDLRWKDIDLQTGQITCITKGGKEVNIPIHEDLVKIIRRWRIESGAISHKLFLHHSYEKEYRRIIRSLKLEGVVFHTLRHTFCSKLAMAGNDIETIAALAGHSSLETTRRYIHLSPRYKKDAVNSMVYNF